MTITTNVAEGLSVTISMAFVTLILDCVDQDYPGYSFATDICGWEIEAGAEFIDSEAVFKLFESLVETLRQDPDMQEAFDRETWSLYLWENLRALCVATGAQIVDIRDERLTRSHMAMLFALYTSPGALNAHAKKLLEGFNNVPDNGLEKLKDKLFLALEKVTSELMLECVTRNPRYNREDLTLILNEASAEFAANEIPQAWK